VARIHRFTVQSAAGIVLQQAQQVGLPAQNPQIQAAIGQMLVLMYQHGIFLAVDDTSPFFEQLQRLQGRTQTTRMAGGNGQMYPPVAPVAPVAPAYSYMYPPTSQPGAQMPSAPMPGAPMPGVPFAVAHGAVDPRTGRPFPMAGQPLPEMNPPVAVPLTGPMPQVVHPGLPQPAQQVAPHRVPLAAPVLGAGPELVAPVISAPRRHAPAAPVPSASAPVPAGAPIVDAPPSLTTMPAETSAVPPGPPMAG